MLWGARRGNRTIVAINLTMEHPMPQPLNDLSRALVALEQDATLIAVIEMSQSSWLIAGVVPGVERQPLKKLTTDQHALLQLLHRWQKEAEETGHVIKWIAVAYEAGRDGFWLARWLRAREIEAYVIHPPAFRYPASIDGRRPIASTLSSSSALFLVGCAVNPNTAAWPRFPRSRMKMQGGPAASARTL
jgi:hypothetical protein